MLDGIEGPAVAAAMDLLVRYGEALDCEHLCDVRNVAGTMTQPSPVKARLVAEGGWDKAFAVINLDCDDDLEIPPMRVATCQLQQGFGADAAGDVPYPAQLIELQGDAEAFYGRHGVNILATCTPYQVGNIPGARRALRVDGVIRGDLRQLRAGRQDQLRGNGVHRCRLAHRQGAMLGEPSRRQPVRHPSDRCRCPGGRFRRMGDARVLRRRTGRRGTPRHHRRHRPARPGRAQAFRSRRGHVRRRGAVPHPGDHPGGPDRGRRVRPGAGADPVRYGADQRRAVYEVSTPRAPAPTWTSSCWAARTPRWTRSARPPGRLTAAVSARPRSCG